MWTQNKGSFFFKGKQFNYYDHPYNAVGMNERTVEIPIASSYFEKYRGKDVLEVGHTLGHYLNSYNHDIVDKCEEAKGVTNIDIIDYEPNKKYDFIFSISTIEHIGNDPVFDEQFEVNKINKAVDKCFSLLKPGGLFLCTFPVGFNKNLDSKIKNKEIQFDELYTFGREGTLVNHWLFTSFETAYNSDLKNTHIGIKDLEGNIQPFNIWFFVCIGMIYNKEKV
jgi:SAM-dependent methyltransferase